MEKTKKSRQRGAKKPAEGSGTSPEKKALDKPVQRKKGKKDPNDRTAEDLAELELVIEDLRSELRFRDEDYVELRDEVAILKAQNE